MLTELRIIAAIGVIIMVLSGGGAALCVAPFLNDYSNPPPWDIEPAGILRSTLWFFGIPFLIGLLIFVLALSPLLLQRITKIRPMPGPLPRDYADRLKVGDSSMTQPATTIVAPRPWRGRPVHELSDGTFEAFTDSRWQRFKDWNELQTGIN